MPTPPDDLQSLFREQDCESWTMSAWRTVAIDRLATIKRQEGQKIKLHERIIDASRGNERLSEELLVAKGTIARLERQAVERIIEFDKYLNRERGKS